MKLSCVACRQKKIKCDRESPCSHCEKSGTPCVPQTRAKTIRKSRKPDESLLQRLKQLESIVSKLENGSHKEDLQVNVVPATQSPFPSTVKSDSESAYTDSGKLIQRNGQTKYVPSGFWMTLTTQIAEHLSEILGEAEDGDTPSDDDAATPDGRQEQDSEMPSPSFVLGFTSDSMTLRLLHPSAERIREMWALYMENCRPVIKTVYIPTGTERVRRAMTDLTSLSHAEEAWMFCIYYLVALSASPEECLHIFGLEKATALDRFRWASEQSLARANFLLSQDLLLLEAFQIYCITLSRHIDNYTVRAMISLLVNVAHSMGLHRDGEQFGLPPFDVERRRKLWWGVRTIDLRSSLDYDAQSLLMGRWSDTKFPTNLKEEDIYPGMTEIPKPRSEPTDVSFTLMRWELTDAMIEIGKIAQRPDQQSTETLESLNRSLDDLGKHIQNKYLQDVPTDDLVNNSDGWIAVRVFRMLMARLWLIANSVVINSDVKNGVNSKLRQEAFEKACAALTTADELEQVMIQLRWGWLFHKRMNDWQSICIVLLELTHKFDGVEGIWNVMNRIFAKWPRSTQDFAPRLEKPLRRLYNRAQTAYLHAKQEPSLGKQASLSSFNNEESKGTQASVTFDNGNSDRMAMTTSDLQHGIRSDLQDPLNFDNFLEDYLPTLDQFDLFETMLHSNDIPVEWKTWNEVG